MATKAKIGGHTAGIFSDMSIDGPEIGTLITIIDRAKNLPNLKTIGKQDPYCAARLGKEAKKTTTDRRGGQTPRWDQELRFRVHDSSDYYQLKVSIFNDDKKTDLIGETWVNLQDIIVPGGGQSDVWHTLNCKGKYAGDVRIEITYYDTRPKQERQEKKKQINPTSIEEPTRESLRGPRQQSEPIKRRPLPSDPVTGEPAPMPAPMPSPLSNQVSTPPRASIPSSYIPNDSPLQNIEYNNPPHRLSKSQSYNQAQTSRTGHSTTPRGSVVATQPPHAMQSERHELYDPLANERSHREQPDYHERHRDYYENHPDYYEDDAASLQNGYNQQYSPYAFNQPIEYEAPPSPGPPPPPPAHGSFHGPQYNEPFQGINEPVYAAPLVSRSPNMYEMPSHNRQRSMQIERQSSSYQNYSTPANEERGRKSISNNDYRQSPLHQESYNSRYSTHHGSMQPTVEDEPTTPPSAPMQIQGHRDSGAGIFPYDDDERYDQIAAPAPLNLSRRSDNHLSNGSFHEVSDGFAEPPPSNNSLVRYGERISDENSFHTSYNNSMIQTRAHSQEIVPRSPVNYGLPSSLVAGINSSMPQESQEMIYRERQNSFRQMSTSPGARYQEASQYQQGRSHPVSHHEPASSSYVSPSYDERPSRHSTGEIAGIHEPHTISPNSRLSSDSRIIPRKSVSPSPAPIERRLSGIPFGPDSYDALNPSLSGSRPNSGIGSTFEPPDMDPDAKIITHDGREIDPSDHIPESNYAPLLPSKQPKYASQVPDRNYRSPQASSQLVLAQTTPVRKTLKHTERPQSMVLAHHSYMGDSRSNPATPSSTGRTRLQKKSNRMSTQTAPHSSPLAPISPYQDNTYIPRAQRAQTIEYHHNENHSPSPYGSSPGYRGNSGAPPLPAKVPIDMNQSSYRNNDDDAWALLEEMKSIDLGTGRARRRG